MRRPPATADRAGAAETCRWWIIITVVRARVTYIYIIILPTQVGTRENGYKWCVCVSKEYAVIFYNAIIIYLYVYYI